MDDLSKQGSIAFWWNPGTTGWETDELTYRFQQGQHGIEVAGCKHADKTLEVRISGPFSRDYRFVCPAPECGPRGLAVWIQWGDDKVTLFLNNVEVETKDKFAPLLTGDSAAFTSKTDASARAAEQAIAFHIAGRLLADFVIDNSHAVHNVGAALVPAIVCDAFSMELYLKALHHLDHGTAPFGHDLKKLFEALAPATQLRIREKYEVYYEAVDAALKARFEFDVALGDCAKAFERWRYVHELNPSKGDLAYSGVHLKEALRDVCRELMPASFAFENE